MSKMKDLIAQRAVPQEVLRDAARGALSVSPAENLEILVHLSRDAVFGEEAKKTLQQWNPDAIVSAIADPSTSKDALQWAVSPENPRSGQVLFRLAKRSGDSRAVEKLASTCPAPVIMEMLASEEVRSSEPLLRKLLSNPNLKPDQAAMVQTRIRSLHAASSAAGTQASEKPASVPANAATSAAAKAQAIPTEPEKSAPSAATEPSTGNQATSTQPETPVKTDASSAEAPAEPVDKEAEEHSNTWISQHATEIAAEEDTAFALVGGLDENSEGKEGETVELEKLEDSAKKGAISQERLSTLQRLSRMKVSERIKTAMLGTREERGILIRDTSRLVCMAVLASPKLSAAEVEGVASMKNVRDEVLRELARNRQFRKNYLIVKNLCNNPKTPLDVALSLLNDLHDNDLRGVSMNKNVPETLRKIADKKFKDKAAGKKS